MGKVQKVLPGALIAGITFSGNEMPDKAESLLEDAFGPIEMKSAVFDFTMTDHYVSEMGEDLKKYFCCFTHPIELDTLPDIKLRTNEIEFQFAEGDEGNLSRTVNIDPGYVTLSKLVLASTKDYSHRIYIGKGIYAETTLRFVHKTFAPVDTTYPDYRLPLAVDFFNMARDFVKRNRELWIQNKE